MNKLHKFLILMALLTSGLAHAEDIKPGLWKISLESTVAAAPGWKPEPFSLTQCLTEADAKNPNQLLAGMGSAGVTGCDFSNQENTGSHSRFDLNCGGGLGITGHGEMDFSATRLDGTLEVSFTDAAQGGQKTAMQNKLHAVYLGDCKTANDGVPLPPVMNAPTAIPAPPVMNSPAALPVPPAE